MIKAGIIGVTGYAGAELARLLLDHPNVTITAASSVTYEGQPLAAVYPSYHQFTDVICTDEDEVIDKSDVIFAALPAGLSQNIAKKALAAGKKFIDLGADFRLDSEALYEKWYGNTWEDADLQHEAVYGMPEFFREDIVGARIVANPGCYTTAVPMAVAPLVANHWLVDYPIICDCKSGITGAGRQLTETTHFPVINEGCHPYKIAAHRHTPEMEQTLTRLANHITEVTFVPHLIPVNRGILATCYMTLANSRTAQALHDLYRQFYADEPFVRVLPDGAVANIASVRYSNLCDVSIHFDAHTNTVITVSAIDNMVKGAAGQAIQNMNIICGLPETTGLLHVPPAF
ncbi:MAG: N-acetyl-gamma-glutamyl-phosphate reductase [Clostridiales bacterium]|nr:N-acetyl-gamma-glutamyl-phosphate reductase [Peptococcus niger]MDU7244228.1 N-acetyl-gamma-glutamyl-phosphate reductase [Clostridiales bacterium]